MPSEVSGLLCLTMLRPVLYLVVNATIAPGDSMPIPTRNILPVLFCGLFLGSVAVVRADQSMSRQAQDQLRQAESATGIDQSAHLKAALDILEHLPSGYSRHAKAAAITDVKAAIFEAQQGDPDHKVTHYIQNAEDEAGRTER